MYGRMSPVAASLTDTGEAGFSRCAAVESRGLAAER